MPAIAKNDYTNNNVNVEYLSFRGVSRVIYVEKFASGCEAFDMVKSLVTI